MSNLTCYNNGSNVCPDGYTTQMLYAQGNDTASATGNRSIIAITPKTPAYVLGELLASIVKTTSRIFKRVRTAVVDTVSTYRTKQTDLPPNGLHGIQKENLSQEKTDDSSADPKSNVDDLLDQSELDRFFSEVKEKYVIINELRENYTANLKRASKALKREPECNAPSSYVPSRLESGYLPKNGGLEENLQGANELLLSTLKKVHFSGNNVVRSLPRIRELAKKHGTVVNDLSEITSTLESCISTNKQLAMLKAFFAKKIPSSFSRMELLRQITEYTFIGNCGDMSIVAFFEGMERGVWNTQLDIVGITPGDHAVVIIGRNPESDPEDYKTWGPSAVVLDAWAGKVFKLSDVETDLNDYVEKDKSTGEPLLKLFDPETQKLHLEGSNICSPGELATHRKNDMTDEQSELYDAVVRQLKQFRQIQTLPEKLVEANTLYELCSHPSIRDFRVIEFLGDQLSHFIDWAHQRKDFNEATDYCSA